MKSSDCSTRAADVKVEPWRDKAAVAVLDSPPNGIEISRAPGVTADRRRVARRTPVHPGDPRRRLHRGVMWLASGARHPAGSRPRPAGRRPAASPDARVGRSGPAPTPARGARQSAPHNGIEISRAPGATADPRRVAPSAGPLRRSSAAASARCEVRRRRAGDLSRRGAAPGAGAGGRSRPIDRPACQPRPHLSQRPPRAPAHLMACC